MYTGCVEFALNNLLDNPESRSLLNLIKKCIAWLSRCIRFFTPCGHGVKFLINLFENLFKLRVVFVNRKLGRLRRLWWWASCESIFGFYCKCLPRYEGVFVTKECSWKWMYIFVVVAKFGVFWLQNLEFVDNIITCGEYILIHWKRNLFLRFTLAPAFEIYNFHLLPLFSEMKINVLKITYFWKISKSHKYADTPFKFQSSIEGLRISSFT